MVGVAKGTVLKFLSELGEVCEAYHDENVRGIKANRVQRDEIWACCHCKEKNVPESMRGTPGVGDVWTWTALDSETTLMIGGYVGDRDAKCAGRFMLDLSRRLDGRCQLTTDGHKVYERAVQDAFGWAVDYAMLVKQYGEPREKEQRYSPCECIGTIKIPISGRPLSGSISTSHVERSNLSMRMGMRRYTRLTNAFSKKLANHRASVALYFMFYNICRVHQTRRVTPAMQAGIADHDWELDELVRLLEAQEGAVIGTSANRRGRYAKKK